MATHFFWDPVEDNIVQERDDTGAVTADYTTEPYLYGDLISQRRSGQSRFYCFDGLGSSRALTDSSGNVTDTNTYTAFGEVTEQTGSTVNPFLYIGQKGYYQDVETREYLVRQRRLLPFTGRWSSADPVGFEPTNAYGYVENRPVTHIDPSGLKCEAIDGPFSPSFATETWYGRIEGSGCGMNEGDEGSYKVVVTFWAWDSRGMRCDTMAGDFFRLHKRGVHSWKYRAETKCEQNPVEVTYRDSWIAPPGTPKRPFHACPSVTFVFKCPVICSGNTCRPFPLGGKGSVCIGTSAGSKCALIDWSITFPDGDPCNRCPPCGKNDASIKLGEDDFEKFP